MSISYSQCKQNDRKTPSIYDVFRNQTKPRERRRKAQGGLNVTDRKERFINLDEVIYRTGLKTTSIYTLMKRGRFPKNIKLTNDRVGWLESDIDRWIDDRIKASLGH